MHFGSIRPTTKTVTENCIIDGGNRKGYPHLIRPKLEDVVQCSCLGPLLFLRYNHHRFTVMLSEWPGDYSWRCLQYPFQFKDTYSNYPTPLIET